jgi:hypothetical protein
MRVSNAAENTYKCDEEKMILLNMLVSVFAVKGVCTGVDSTYWKKVKMGNFAVLI